MQHTVAVETGEVLPRAAGVDGVEDGVAVAEESCVGTDERKRESKVKSIAWLFGFNIF